VIILLIFNMLAKRIIPCLDVKDGTTVKGVHFVDFRNAGDPVELGRQYSAQGADELVYLDITASHEGRKTFLDLVRRVAATVSIPFTVGGGINELGDVDNLLNAGADKVSINSAAIRNPKLIEEIARNFGSQVCVVAIDAKPVDDAASTRPVIAGLPRNPLLWTCFLNGGRIPTDKNLFAWAKEAENRGAGEILFTSMAHDGAKTGYANDALARLSDDLGIPIIASGGAGTKEHFRDVFTLGKADAALAASVFHFGEIPIPELKRYLRQENITIR
jgi:cyclase